ncbi:transposase [Oscillospiraceae bacterium HV4-5-C5C]|nr:transposase [Oscillospiraceae bacterium HV4-5-C5C]
MVDGLNLLEVILGRSLFQTYAGILLTDRGSEFEAPVAMETAQDGSQRAHVFYCNSMAAGQKGSLENNHIELRYILPKATDLRALGLTCQAALNLALSHINSASVESLGGRCPLEVTHFLFPALYNRLSHFGLHLIPNDEVMLKPELLKAFR